MSQENNKIDVGVGVMIFKDGKILMGKRKGSHGEGDYAFTGGHLEYMESFEECAKRETLEEAGISIKNVKFLSLGNIGKYAPKHVIGIGVTAEWESGEPVVCEPNKRESWDWYDVENLPQPIFYPATLMIEAYKNGRIYNDKE
jgi:8-oxo-dGTP diphosphatase